MHNSFEQCLAELGEEEGRVKAIYLFINDTIIVRVMASHIYIFT